MAAFDILTKTNREKVPIPDLAQKGAKLTFLRYYEVGGWMCVIK